MDKTDSKFNLIHALTASGILVAAVSNNYWHNFIHGQSGAAPKIPILIFSIACQVGLYGLMFLILWATTLFNREGSGGMRQWFGNVLPSLKAALVAFPGICVFTFAIEWLSTAGLEFFFNVKLPPQNIIDWLKPEVYPFWVRLVLVLTALLEAPLMEELLFRKVIFRGFGTVMPIWLAMALSGFLFAVVHVNAATFLPLWYLGVALAWIYWRTGSILAPMFVHFLFNVTNLILLACCD